MKNMLAFYWFLGICSSFYVATSCGKDLPLPEVNPPSIDTLQTLQNGAWILEQDSFDWNQDGIFVESLDSCQRFDNWSFLADGVFKTRDNSPVCDPITPFNFEGTWEFDHVKKIIKIDFDFYPEPAYYYINYVDSVNLRLHTVDPDNLSAPVSEKIILRR